MDNNAAETLLYKYLSGKASAEEKAELLDLIKENPDLKDEVDMLQQHHFSMEVLEEKEKICTEETLHAVNNLIRHKRQRRILRFTLLSAASMTILCVAAYLLRIVYIGQDQEIDLSVKGDHIVYMANGEFYQLDSGATTKADTSSWVATRDLLTVKGPDKTEAWNILMVPEKRDYSVKLPDGTEVQLNSATTMRFSGDFKKNREVFISGEALFIVAKDPLRPFKVHAGECDILVLGTAFNVNTYSPHTTTTSLISGSIKIDADGKEQLIKPLTEGTYKQGKLTVAPFDIGNTVSWRDGIYVLRDNKLKDIVPLIQRWYGIHTTIEGKALNDVVISGTINKEQDLSVFMENLSTTANIQYTLEGKEMVITQLQEIK